MTKKPGRSLRFKLPDIRMDYFCKPKWDTIFTHCDIGEITLNESLKWIHINIVRGARLVTTKNLS